jgi:predicted dienelactone hydrolase
MLEVAVWYPTQQKTPAEKINSDIWKIKDAIKNASLDSTTKLPLIIFSHGYSGDQWAHTWFAEHFAEHGYIVAIVRHYGNSYPNMIPEICVRPWNRPQDLSFVLDQLLKHPQFKDSIDTNRIGAAGFSQGGVACMWLAGVEAHLTRENLKQQITMVHAPEYKQLHFKDIPSDRLNAVLDNFTEQDFKQANCSYYDQRFKAVFVMAPGIDEENIMFTPHSLSQSKMPMHITVGQMDEGTVEQSIFFSEHIPYCTLTIIPGYVTHWPLLNEGTQEGKLKRPIYTIDHPSVDRKKIHASTASEALEFFNLHFIKHSTDWHTKTPTLLGSSYAKATKAT